MLALKTTFDGHSLHKCILVLSLILWSFFLSTVLAKARETKVEPAIAFAAKIIGDKSRARIIVDFDREIEPDPYLDNEPDRLIIDLPETLFNLDSDAEVRSDTLFTEMRVGTIAPGKSRIIVALSGPVVIGSRTFKQVSDSNRYRLIVDVVRANQTDFEAALRSDNKDGSRAKSETDAKTKYTIVIDPGHGGIDGGATGQRKTAEKEITLQFAKKLRVKLQENPSFNVILTREADTFLGLRERVAIARRSKADLMISVHADSLKQHYIRGATVYTLSEKGSDELSRELASEQNKADLVAGLNLPDVEPKVTDILIDLTRRETAVFSNQFANLMVNNLKKDVVLIKNPHRSADFFVLKAPEIPSILLELGYLSNSKDEKLMRSPKWQNSATTGVKNAIEKFFAHRVAQQ